MDNIWYPMLSPMRWPANGYGMILLFSAHLAQLVASQLPITWGNIGRGAQK